jgi:hypothetical protein
LLASACGYALDNKAHDARAIQGLARSSVDHQHCRLHGAGAEQVQGLLAQLSGTEAEAPLMDDRPVAPPGKSPRAPRSSVLLTRLYAPSGDVAEPAYAARTSHWTASTKRRQDLEVALGAWGLRGQLVSWASALIGHKHRRQPRARRPRPAGGGRPRADRSSGSSRGRGRTARIEAASVATLIRRC